MQHPSMAVRLAVHVVQCVIVGVIGALGLMSFSSVSAGNELAGWLFSALIGGETGAMVAILSFPMLNESS